MFWFWATQHTSTTLLSLKTLLLSLKTLLQRGGSIEYWINCNIYVTTKGFSIFRNTNDVVVVGRFSQNLNTFTFFHVEIYGHIHVIEIVLKKTVKSLFIWKQNFNWLLPFMNHGLLFFRLRKVVELCDWKLAHTMINQ